MLALIDVNNFYASCETIFRPDLHGKPIVVLSNNDGCVIARSREAQKCGIKMGEPWFKVARQAEQNGVVAFSSNYALYADMSNRVMSLLAQLTPHVEKYSIDEAFCDLSGIPLPELNHFGRQLREDVRRCTHLTVGVGIATTKTLAKLANYAAKHWKKTGGVVDLSIPERQRRLMAHVPVEEVWGVGKRLARHLVNMGITTALQLANMPPAVARRRFTVTMERTVRELNGIPCLEIEPLNVPKKQIVCSRSFGEKPSDFVSVSHAICAHAERAAEKLRREQQWCREISVFIATSRHASGTAFYSKRATTRLTTPTHDSRDIIAAARKALEQVFIEGQRYHRCGVRLSDFTQSAVTQLNLFDDTSPSPKSEKLMQLLDTINKGSKQSVWFAGQGILEKKDSWKMKRERLSPAWTTRFEDIPIAHLK